MQFYTLPIGGILTLNHHYKIQSLNQNHMQGRELFYGKSARKKIWHFYKKHIGTWCATRKINL